jgi:hypothetical protein
MKAALLIMEVEPLSSLSTKKDGKMVEVVVGMKDLGKHVTDPYYGAMEGMETELLKDNSTIDGKPILISKDT